MEKIMWGLGIREKLKYVGDARKKQMMKSEKMSSGKKYVGESPKNKKYMWMAVNNFFFHSAPLDLK